jgi:hypothetical protein
MIRYVLAVILTTAILGVAIVGVDHAGTIRGERQVENQIAAVDQAANSLLDNEDPPPPGQDGARRVVELDLPKDGFTSDSVETLIFERQPGTNVTLVTYRFDGRSEQTESIEAPIENADPGTTLLDFSGSTDSHVLVLELRRDEHGNPVIEATTE